MTKLASALPDGHGLDAVRHILLGDPHAKHVAITVLDCSKVTIDHDKGSREATAGIRSIEVVTIPEDLDLAHKLTTRAKDKRLGATVLPLGIEDDLAEAFKVRSEDVDTDVTEIGALDEDQVKALARSLDRPLRHEVTEAVHALRGHKDWVTLGRARRVLELAARKLEENDKRLLRNEDGFLVDPATGEIVDEDKLTSDDLDRMLAALAGQEGEIEAEGESGDLDNESDDDAECDALDGELECPRCEGAGNVIGDDGTELCGRCGGTGLDPDSD
jgi:hypothetical protein